MVLVFAAMMALAAPQAQFEPAFEIKIEDVGAWRLNMANVAKTAKPFLRMMSFHQEPVTLTIGRLDKQQVAISFDAPPCGVPASVFAKAIAQTKGVASKQMLDGLRDGLRRLSELCPFPVQVIEQAAFADLEAAWLRLETAEF